MNTYKYNSFLIKSKLLSKIDIVYKNAINQNYYYIQNLKDFIDNYMDDNIYMDVNKYITIIIIFIINYI